MTENNAVNSQNWDVDLYDQSFGFISEFGAGLVELLAPSPGECVIDLGCGIGQLSAQIAAQGCDVIGIDAYYSIKGDTLPEAETSRHSIHLCGG